MAVLDVLITMEQLKPVEIMDIGQLGLPAAILIVEELKQEHAPLHLMVERLAVAQAHKLVQVPNIIPDFT